MNTRRRKGNSWASCTLCARRFPKADIEAHMKTCHQLHECGECGHVFLLQEELIEHVQSEHTGRPKRMRRAPAKLAEMETETADSDSDTGPRKTIAKKVGGITSPSKKRKVVDESEEEEEDRVGCTICGHKAASMRAMTEHMMTHMERFMVFSCETCSAEFPTKNKLLNHKMLLHNPDVNKYLKENREKDVNRKETSQSEPEAAGSSVLAIIRRESPTNVREENLADHDDEVGVTEIPPKPATVPSIIHQRPYMRRPRGSVKPSKILCVLCRKTYGTMHELNAHRKTVHQAKPVIVIKSETKSAKGESEKLRSFGAQYCCLKCEEGPLTKKELEEHKFATGHEVTEVRISSDMKKSTSQETEHTERPAAAILTEQGNNEEVISKAEEIREEGGHESDEEYIPEEDEEFIEEVENEDKDEGKNIEEDSAETTVEDFVEDKTDETRIKDIDEVNAFEVEKENQPATDSDEFLCSICQKIFATDADRQNHCRAGHSMEEVVGDEVSAYQCEKCARIFGELDDLQYHGKTCSKPDEKNDQNVRTLYACYVCAETQEEIQYFVSQEAVETHRRNVHGEYKCNVCELRFGTKHDLKVHKEEHPNLSYYCEKCGLIVNSESGLRDHLKSEHGVCPVCEESCHDADTLIKHMNEMHTKHKTRDRFKCDVCNKGFTYKSRLENHQRIHSGTPKFHCDLCSKVFMHDNTFKNHLRRHKGEKPVYYSKPSSGTMKKLSSYLCGTCGKSFANRSTLLTHEATHNSVSTFKCEFCPKVFTTMLYLKNHEKLHTTTPHIKCTLCPKTFRTTTRLVEHQVSHTGQKDYHCQLCGFSTGTINRLRKHQKSRHFEVKYTCPDCSMQLTTFTGLTRHYLSHTKEFPYKCGHCMKPFYIMANAKRHVEFHMKKGINATVIDNLGQPYSCSDCGKSLRTFAGLIIHLYTTHKMTKEQFPDLPSHLKEARDFYDAVGVGLDEEPLFYGGSAEAAKAQFVILKDNSGRPDNDSFTNNNGGSTSGHNDVTTSVSDASFSIMTSDGQTLEVGTGVTLPASLDREALQMAVQQLMAIQQTSGDQTEVTITLPAAAQS